MASGTSCSSTQKHSVQPRPCGSSGSASRPEVKRASKRSRMASSAPRSQVAGVSRTSIRTWAPVRRKERMRRIVRVRPTLRIPSSDQWTA